MITMITIIIITIIEIIIQKIILHFNSQNLQYKWLTNILIMTNSTLYVCYAKKHKIYENIKFFYKKKKKLIYCFLPLV